MATLTIERIDDELARRIEELPAERRDMMDRQLRQVVQTFVAQPDAALTRCEIADRIAEMTPKGVAQTDSVLLLREDRDR